MHLKVSVSPYQKEESNLRGFASVTVDNVLSIHGIQIVEGEKGLFIAMPQSSKVNEEGKKIYSDLIYPTTAETRKALSEAVLETYFPEGSTYNETQFDLAPNDKIEVRVTPYTKEGRQIRAMASASLCDFKINNITLLQGGRGLFVSYPSKKYTNTAGDVQFKDVVEIAPAQRQIVNGMLINEYKHAKEQQEQQPKEGEFVNVAAQDADAVKHFSETPPSKPEQPSKPEKPSKSKSKKATKPSLEPEKEPENKEEQER